MTSKERLQRTLNHQNTDKIVVDFGATPVSGIHVLTVSRLREYFGLSKQPVKVVEPYQMLGEVDNELAEILGVDVIGITNRQRKQLKFNSVVPRSRKIGIRNDKNTVHTL